MPSTPRSASAPVTLFGPDFPFAFDDWIAHPQGLGEIPPERLGQEVAIVARAWPAWWRLTS